MSQRAQQLEAELRNLLSLVLEVGADSARLNGAVEDACARHGITLGAPESKPAHEVVRDQEPYHTEEERAKYRK